MRMYVVWFRGDGVDSAELVCLTPSYNYANFILDQEVKRYKVRSRYDYQVQIMDVEE